MEIEVLDAKQSHTMAKQTRCF